MNPRQFINKVIIGAWMTLVMTLVHGAKPLWTITPLTETNITVPENGTRTIIYQVTNQSKKTHTLIMKDISGITQVTTPDNCPKSFVLGYKESCLLHLIIKGNTLKGSVMSGPVLCNNGNPNQCYQPSAANSLRITKGSAAPRRAYIPNNDATISVCNINADGIFTSCQNSGVTFSEPLSIALNADGFKAYVGDATTRRVSVCSIEPSDGTFSGCIDSTQGAVFDYPAGIALNPAGNRVYITNDNTTVSVCAINRTDGTFSSCQDSGVIFGDPEGIAMSADGSKAYVGDTGTGSVLVCSINQSGKFSACVDSGQGSIFNYPVGIAINTAGNRVYITNDDTTVSVCAINRTDGTFSSCQNSGVTFPEPDGIAISADGSKAYVGDTNTGRVLVCSINLSGTFSGCADSGQGSNFYPIAIALS